MPIPNICSCNDASGDFESENFEVVGDDCLKTERPNYAWRRQFRAFLFTLSPIRIISGSSDSRNTIGKVAHDGVSWVHVDFELLAGGNFTD